MKTHLSFKHLLFIGGAVLYSMHISAVKNPVDYVSTLVGTQSKFELSTGNTYPATALPWGMNFWTPQTGKMGDRCSRLIIRKKTAFPSVGLRIGSSLWPQPLVSKL